MCVFIYRGAFCLLKVNVVISCTSNALLFVLQVVFQSRKVSCVLFLCSSQVISIFINLNEKNYSNCQICLLKAHLPLSFCLPWIKSKYKYAFQSKSGLRANSFRASHSFSLKVIDTEIHCVSRICLCCLHANKIPCRLWWLDLRIIATKTHSFDQCLFDALWYWMWCEMFRCVRAPVNAIILFFCCFEFTIFWHSNGIERVK